MIMGSSKVSHYLRCAKILPRNLDFENRLQSADRRIDFDSFRSSIPKAEHTEGHRYADDRCHETDSAESSARRPDSDIECRFVPNSSKILEQLR